METTSPIPPVSGAQRWTGYILSALPSLLIAFSAAMKLARAPGLAESFDHLGWPVGYALGLGLLELACMIVYLIPRTAVLGAILLTGYLGGATATHVRVGDPTFWAPALLGVLLWGGLYLRDPRLRVLLPLRR